MLRSFLFFSGVNLKQNESTLSAEEQNDGVLNAYEASLMNLTNTELVVLSSCQSGLGKIHNGEGVYGMQRGFKLAGTRYIIMSLWNVNDIITSYFMIEFYSEMRRGLSIRNAFNKAQKKIKAKYNNPYFWAPFVLFGI
jgi:CHAT domain-containing protein